MPSLLDFFTRSLTAFQSSPAPFRTLCTLPHQSREPAPRPARTASSSSSSSTTTLIVLDASFNPPTTAHLSMLLSAQPTRVLLLLSVNNADKPPQPASFPQRLCMMAAFAEEYIARAGTTTTTTTLDLDIGVTTRAYFHEKATAVAQSGFYTDGLEQIYLAGFDTLIRIFDEKYYPAGITTSLDPFFSAARLRITARPDDQWGTLGEQEDYLKKLPRKLEEKHERGWWVDRVEMVKGGEEGDGVSSSRVRNAVSKGDGEELEKLVGKGVREWIEGEGLYKE